MQIHELGCRRMSHLLLPSFHPRHQQPEDDMTVGSSANSKEG